MIAVGDLVPAGEFKYVPYTPDQDDAAVCGLPSSLSTAEWAGKKVVLFSVPGAFTPTCHVNHLPPFLQKCDEFKAKGVDVVAVVAANDHFVMSGWARVEGLKDKILALSDPNARWSSQLGLSTNLTDMGMGIRTRRYALILDNLVVKYVGAESVRTSVTVSGADAVLAALEADTKVLEKL